MSSDIGGQQSQAQDSEALAGRIRELASKGEFVEAEAIREQMMGAEDIPLALIVSTAEFIEEQKTKFLDPDHLELWSELYENFTEEEINCVFYSFKKATIGPGKLVTIQGKLNNRLYFVENGTITFFYRKDGKNLPVIKLEKGDIFGEETFFQIAICSLSSATQSDVTLRYVMRKDAETWDEKVPGLLDKLGEFCRKHGKVEEAVREAELDRRSTYRYSAAGAVTAQILNQHEKRTSAYFKGGIIDISQSGICFTMKCSKMETARALLSRRLDLSIEFKSEEENPYIVRGTIVKVSFHLHNDYSVHVNFDEIITEDVFRTFPCDWPDEEPESA
jgi:CRP-like cAMP-binding protein